MKKHSVPAMLIFLAIFSMSMVSCSSKSNSTPVEQIPGPQGEKGEKGEQGEPGQNGRDGVSIVSISKTSSDGLVDTYTITYSDQHTSTFTVVNGENGSQGIQGNPGADGHTPNIAINNDGYWCVDGVSTGFKAQGETGQQGPQGNQGDPGQNGKDGTSLLTGTGEPSSELGKTGDSYIDLNNWNYYVKETSGWMLKGNIKGADGANGQDGKKAVF